MQAAIYQIHRVSACLHLISPSHSSLHPPCYEAIMWIFMKSDLYQQKTSTLHTLGILPSFFISSLLQPSILFSFTHLYFSFLSASFTSLPLTLFLRLHLHLICTFLMSLMQPSFQTWIQLLLPLARCVCGWMCVQWYDAHQRSWAGIGAHSSARTQRLPTGRSSTMASWRTTTCCQK